MVEVNLNVKVTVPALDKLIDYVASGIGATAGVALAPWRASREGKARIIAAKADAEVKRIEASAENSTAQMMAKERDKAREYVATLNERKSGSRGTISNDVVQKAAGFQASKRLMNIGAIAGHAAEELGDTEVPDHDPDPDWVARFFDGAQDVSSEELQKLWGKILAGEIKSPGQTSLRTLSILRDMTQQEAKDFLDLMRFRIADFIFDKGAKRVLRNFSSLIVDFSHIGLFGGFGDVSEIRLDSDGKWKATYYGHSLTIEGPPGQDLGPRITLISHKIWSTVITRAGMELAKLCQHEPNSLYLSHFSRFLGKHNCKLRIGTIADEDPQNFRCPNPETIKPFVEPAKGGHGGPDDAE